MKMSVLASTTVGDNDDELGFDTKLIHWFANDEELDNLGKDIEQDSESDYEK